jgi:hypothetical protein
MGVSNIAKIGVFGLKSGFSAFWRQNPGIANHPKNTGSCPGEDLTTKKA